MIHMPTSCKQNIEIPSDAAHPKAVSLDQWPRSKIPANAKSYHF